MANQEGLTIAELEMIRECPARLWHYYCSEPCLEQPKSALLQLMKLTKVFNAEFEQLQRELKQNMLTFIENTLSLIRFMTNSFDDLNHTSVDALNEFHEGLVQLSINLATICPSEIEEQMLRIDSHYGDIVVALQQIRQLEESGAVNVTPAEGGSDAAWQPFFSSPNRFQTDVEKVFITNLRDLYLRTEEVTSNELLVELIRMFESTPMESLSFSFESSRDTAIRSVLILLRSIKRKAVKECEFVTMNEDGKNFLASSFKIMSSATSTQNQAESSANYRNLGLVRWQQTMLLIHPMVAVLSNLRRTRYERTVFEHDPHSVTACTSLLWRKLRHVKSVDQLLKAVQPRCSICLAVDISNKNFAIMDDCPHLFCEHCIKDWFKIHKTCPNCQTCVRTWTTRKVFSGFLERIFGIVEQSLPEESDSTSEAVKPLLLTAGDSTNTGVLIFPQTAAEGYSNGAV